MTWPAHPLQFFVDGIFIGTVIANISIMMRNRSLIRREILPIYITSMMRMTAAVCPLCALVQGLGTATDDHGELSAEPMKDGAHQVRLGNGQIVTMQCTAFEMHNFIGELRQQVDPEKKRRWLQKWKSI